MKRMPHVPREPIIRLLIVLGEGGHTKQMLNLVDLLTDAAVTACDEVPPERVEGRGHGPHERGASDRVERPYEYHYVISKEDNLSANHIRCPGPIHRVIRPRGKHTDRLGAALRTVWAGIQSLWILLRVRPTAVISAGPAIAVPVSILGKPLGARIIFVESSSRIRALSLTGRILYRWADLFFVQWPQLKEQLPRAIYAGRLV